MYLLAVLGLLLLPGFLLVASGATSSVAVPGLLIATTLLAPEAGSGARGLSSWGPQV